MKKVGILLLFLMCNALFTHAQKETATKTDQREYLIAQIEKSINDIRKDLQEKKLQYNYELIDKYLILCEKNNQIVRESFDATPKSNVPNFPVEYNSFLNCISHALLPSHPHLHSVSLYSSAFEVLVKG